MKSCSHLTRMQFLQGFNGDRNCNATVNNCSTQKEQGQISSTNLQSSDFTRDDLAVGLRGETYLENGLNLGAAWEQLRLSSNRKGRSGTLRRQNELGALACLYRASHAAACACSRVRIRRAATPAPP
jgi:hypothetical protein